MSDMISDMISSEILTAGYLTQKERKRRILFIATDKARWTHALTPCKIKNKKWTGQWMHYYNFSLFPQSYTFQRRTHFIAIVPYNFLNVAFYLQFHKKPSCKYKIYNVSTINLRREILVNTKLNI